jgi:ferric-dicitrate binding protein FerR (iron transport regulator)
MTAPAGGEVEALRVLERELRGEGLPELDWHGIEQHVLERTRDDDEPLRLPRRSHFWPAAGGLAAAAALVLAVMGFVRSGIPPTAELSAPVAAPVVPKAAAAVVDGDRVALGAVVDAAESSVHVKHGKRASWSLERGGRARIVARGESVTVALDQGSLVARVTANPRPESFAVEIADARVAVHGTVFRVERGAERALVEVTEGTVAVGPASTRGATRGFLLVAPASGSFALDGTSAVIDGQGAVVAARGSDPRATASTPRPATKHPSAAGVPESPPMSAIEDGVSRIADLANRCFATHTQRRGDIQIVVATTITFEAAPDGGVQGLGFAPPLAPAVHACVQGGLGAVKFARSREGARVTRTLELRP